MNNGINRRLVVRGFAAALVSGAGLKAIGAAAQDATKVIYGDSLYPPTTCQAGGNRYWLFVMEPNPGPDVQTVEVVFANGSTVTATRVRSASDRAVFRAYGNWDSIPVSLTAVVPADYEPTSFRTGAGPCGNVMPVPTYTVSGYVTQHGNGKPVAGANVCLEGLGVCTVTDANGYYEFTAIEEGTYSVTVTTDGYKPTSGTVVVAGSDAVLNLIQYRGNGRTGNGNT